MIYHNIKIFSVYVISILVLHHDFVASNNEGEMQEYCSHEVFNPQCPKSEVVLMQSARYGHIQLGKCVDVDLGKFGCFLDQLIVMDKLCSGKQMCNVHFLDSTMEGSFPCELPNAFMRYLEASYTCLEVFQPKDTHCNGPSEVKVTSKRGYLSSVTTHATDCGKEANPWVLKAKDGQKINITFTDFYWKYTSRSDSSVGCPVRYGYILDVTNNNIVNLCGGLVRERTLHLSAGNSVQVLINQDVLNDVRFLIGFQAIGCPKYSPPPNTWVKEEDGYLSVGCVDQKEKWRMRCIGTHWLGPQRDCSKYELKQGGVLAANSIEKETGLFGMSNVVVYTLFGAVFIIVGSIVITAVIGFFCIRKPKHKHQNELFVPDNTLPQLVPIDNFPTYKSVQVKAPKHLTDDTMLKCVGSDRTMSSVGSIPRYPAPHKDSPHYYLLEGRDMNDTEPLYDVVYQGSPSENIA